MWQHLNNKIHTISKVKWYQTERQHSIPEVPFCCSESTCGHQVWACWDRMLNGSEFDALPLHTSRVDSSVKLTAITKKASYSHSAHVNVQHKQIQAGFPVSLESRGTKKVTECRGNFVENDESSELCDWWCFEHFKCRKNKNYFTTYCCRLSLNTVS